MKRLITLALLFGLTTPVLAQEGGAPGGGTMAPGTDAGGAQGDTQVPEAKPDPNAPTQRATARPGEEPAPGQRPFAAGSVDDEADLKAFDANADGRIDDSERTVARQIRQARMIQRYDEDGDGQLSQEEKLKLQEGIRNYNWFRDEIGNEEINEDFGKPAPGAGDSQFDENGVPMTTPGEDQGQGTTEQGQGTTEQEPFRGQLENQGPEPGSDENQNTSDGKPTDDGAVKTGDETDVDVDMNDPTAPGGTLHDDNDAAEQTGPDKIREQADEQADALEDQADQNEDTLPEEQTDKMEDDAERLRDQADEQADAVEDREDD